MAFRIDGKSSHVYFRKLLGSPRGQTGLARQFCLSVRSMSGLSLTNNRIERESAIRDKLGNLVSFANSFNGKDKYDFLNVLLRSINIADHCVTYPHSKRMFSHCLAVADSVGAQVDRPKLMRAMLMHDLGKISWPRNMFFKAGRDFTKMEKALIPEHLILGVDLLRVLGFDDVANIVRYNHIFDEYPLELLRDVQSGAVEIPIEAQILIILDYVDARKCPRPYNGNSPCGDAKIRMVLTARHLPAKIIDTVLSIYRTI